MAVFKDFEEIALFGLCDRRQTPVVQDQELDIETPIFPPPSLPTSVTSTSAAQPPVHPIVAPIFCEGLTKDGQTSYLSIGSKRAEEMGAQATPPALLMGSTLFLVGVLLYIFAAEYAGAMGGGNPSAVINAAPTFDSPFSAPAAPRRAYAPRRIFGRQVHLARRTKTDHGGLAMCVRLCDGFYFPNVVTSGGDEACVSQCPDASTASYSVPPGSDKIDDAVSLTGAPYSALPVAHRYQMSFDDTCTCHRSSAKSYVADLLRDRTLRDGDLVMTSKGFMIFRGTRSGVVSASSFLALSQSTVPNAARLELTAMERAGIGERQSGPYSYSSANATAHLHKGIVTIDDGSGTPP
jgi:hypothetical protein